VRVLYVNHTGLVGGAERSLLSLLDSVAPEVETRLACPAGPMHEHATRRGHEPVEIAECAGSLKLHPVHTPIALGAMAVAAGGILRSARGWRAEVVHANSIRAGLIAEPVARALRLPLVLHVRDCLPPSTLTRRLQRALATRSAAVIAISRHVADAFDPDGVAPRLATIDNPFDLARLDPERIDRDAARARLALSRRDLALVLVGQITPWKGQLEAILALAELLADGYDAQLLIVGEAKFVSAATRYDNRAYLAQMKRTITERGLGARVRLLGERDDVPQIMGALDALLVPSWEEPFGRIVVESMAMEVPVIATDVGGPAEILTDGDDGVLLPPRRPARWGEVAFELLSEPSRRVTLGRRGRATVEARFAPERQLEAVLAAYREALST